MALNLAHIQNVLHNALYQNISSPPNKKAARAENRNEPQHVISNNVVFLHVQPPVNLETPNAVRSVA